MPARPIKRGNVWYTYYQDAGKKKWVRLGKSSAERDLAMEDLEGRIDASRRGARAGVPLNVIRDLMGHAQITTTQIYLHTDKRDKFDAIDRLFGIYSPI